MKISVDRAVEVLRENDVVAVPTETVYGLAGKISSTVALKKIFSTKERPFFDPLIVHVLDVQQARTLAREWPREIDTLTEKFWPGPLTVVVPRQATVDPLITSGLETVGVRAPAHPTAREVLQKLGEPFAAPSANRFGRTSPTRAEHVEREFSGQIAVVDGGPSQVGVESTVVRWNPTLQTLEVLRPGAITQEDLALALKSVNPTARVSRAVSQASPGHLEQHYQPRLPLWIVEGPCSEDKIAQLARQYGIDKHLIFDLDLPHEPTLAARELYHRLHLLSQNPSGVIVFWRGDEWKDVRWEAIRDRLERAATLKF